MKKVLFKILKISGLPALFRLIYQKNKVSILMFHDVDPATAEKSFAYLNRKYNIISLNDFINAYYAKDFSDIPPKSLIITFDDGHIGNYEILPVIKKLKIPITIFLCSKIVNTNRHYWFKFEQNKLNNQSLKRKTTKERLKLLSEVGFYKEKDYEEIHALQKEHIETMKPFVNFQSHTMFHPILPMCDDEESKTEIFISKKDLENDFNLKINSFAYPNGDYNDRDVNNVKEAGYKCAVTTKSGVNSKNSDIFRLKRLSVNDTKDLNEFIVKSSGLWGMIKSFI